MISVKRYATFPQYHMVKFDKTKQASLKNKSLLFILFFICIRIVSLDHSEPRLHGGQKWGSLCPVSGLHKELLTQ